MLDEAQSLRERPRIDRPRRVGQLRQIIFHRICKGQRGGARQGTAQMMGKSLPRLDQTGIIGGLERERFAQLEHTAVPNLRESETGMGARQCRPRQAR